jgi:hypothetical protein
LFFYFNDNNCQNEVEEFILRKYHHIGIPTNIARENETYLPKFKMFVSGYESSPYRVEWMRFEPDSPLPDLVKTVPHVAFEVDDLHAEIEGKEVIIQPNSPSNGVTVAFIVNNGAPVEFLQFDILT